jgi:hypothetical protein
MIREKGNHLLTDVHPEAVNIRMEEDGYQLAYDVKSAHDDVVSGYEAFDEPYEIVGLAKELTRKQWNTVLTPEDRINVNVNIMGYHGNMWRFAEDDGKAMLKRYGFDWDTCLILKKKVNICNNPKDTEGNMKHIRMYTVGYGSLNDKKNNGF